MKNKHQKGPKVTQAQKIENSRATNRKKGVNLHFKIICFLLICSFEGELRDHFDFFLNK